MFEDWVKKGLIFLKENEKGEVSSPFSDANLSKVTEVYWIFAWRKKGEYPKSMHLSGKWLVFVDVKDVDSV